MQLLHNDPFSVLSQAGLDLFPPPFILRVWEKVLKYFHPGFSPAKADLPVWKRMHGDMHVWERSTTASARFQKGVIPGNHTVNLPVSQALQQRYLLLNMPEVHIQVEKKCSKANPHLALVQCVPHPMPSFHSPNDRRVELSENWLKSSNSFCFHN